MLFRVSRWPRPVSGTSSKSFAELPISVLGDAPVTAWGRFRRRNRHVRTRLPCAPTNEFGARSLETGLRRSSRHSRWFSADEARAFGEQDQGSGSHLHGGAPDWRVGNSRGGHISVGLWAHLPQCCSAEVVSTSGGATEDADEHAGSTPVPRTGTNPGKSG